MQRLYHALLNSIAGLRWAAKHELAVRQEIAVLIVAVPVSFIVTPEGWKRLVLIGVLLFLLTVEMLNTSIEKLSDHVTPQQHAAIKVVKDMASASVLLALLLAAIAWLIAIGDYLTS